MSNINNAKLSIYASVTIHESHDREKFLERLNGFDGLVPVIHNDTVEWCYEGGRSAVLQLATLAGDQRIHSVRLSAYGENPR